MRPLKDDKALGIEPVSEVDVRSRVCREAASDDDAARVASGDGDNAWELTSLRDDVSEGQQVQSASLTNPAVPRDWSNCLEAQYPFGNCGPGPGWKCA